MNYITLCSDLSEGEIPAKPESRPFKTLESVPIEHCHVRQNTCDDNKLNLSVM